MQEGSAMSSDTGYAVEIDIPVSYMGNLLDFVYQKYLLPQKTRYVDISRTDSGGQSSLSYVVLDTAGRKRIKAQVVGGSPIRVYAQPIGEAVTDGEVTQVRQDVVIAVELFEEKVNETTLFFAWREGEEIVPERDRKSVV
jgi:heat shock protein HtpX